MTRSSVRIVLVIAAVAIFVFSSVGLASASVGLDLSSSVGVARELSAGLARQLTGTESLVAVLPSTSTANDLGLLTVGAGLAATIGGFLLLRRARPQ
jgi:LPXTG-motif cell wall-anchored protein